MKILKSSFIIILIATVIFTSGCAMQSKIPFTPAPDASEGFGLVYVLKEIGGGGAMNISSIHIFPLDNTDPMNQKGFYLIQGEYSWVHLKTGKYEAIYKYPATAERIKVTFKVENKKAAYISLSFANYNYVVINQLKNDVAEKLIVGYKYWEYKFKECTLTMACR